MKRKIISIDEDLCDGCGNCVTDCSEGALQIIDGKAKLVKEQFCDGFGDCIGSCPTGALQIVEREAEVFDIDATKHHLGSTQGKEAVWRLNEAQKRHREKEKPIAHHHQSCPGSMMRIMEKGGKPQNAAFHGIPQAIPSELAQWPVQLHLVPPNAPFFKNKELVFMNTCGPLASADVHWRFLRGRSVIVGCPKLDDTRNYNAKLAEIITEPSIPKILIVRMEVPCCGGLTMMAVEAAKISGRTDIVIEEHIIGINGIMESPRIIQAGKKSEMTPVTYQLY